jgi:hypothetical protein
VGSPEYQEVVQSLDKIYTLNGFKYQVIFMDNGLQDVAENNALNYVKTIEDGSGIPYYGRFEDLLDNDTDDEESSDEFSSDEESDDKGSNDQ